MRNGYPPAWFLVAGLLMLGAAHLMLGHLGAPPARAQSRPQYRECFFARQESVDVNDSGNFETPGQNRRINIPSGWTVVSGGGVDGNYQGNVLLCR